MEATTTDALPPGDGWLYEPKWDGFRCLVFRDGDEVLLQSKSRKPLARYFPEMVDAVRALPSKHFVVDGELAVPVEGSLSFDHLLQRIHPAESRVRKLARSTPASLFVFDLLAPDRATSLVEVPLEERRERLDAWGEEHLEEADAIRLSPATTDRGLAEDWLARLQDVDGIMAKVLDAPYRSGERDAMVKVKRLRTADCVVGGFRYGSSGKAVGSLLLGLYNAEGLLDHVGYTSTFRREEAGRLAELLEARMEGPGFTGKAPGGPSRWTREGRSADWQPVRPDLVVEVRYDHFSGGRFRHGTKLLRMRPDKAPEQCTMEQVRKAGADALRLLEARWR